MRIGIYVNTLPTTVFIDRLIESLIAYGHEVSVFGTELKKFNRVYGATYVSYRLYSFLNYSKVVQFVKYNLLLSLFRRRQKSDLDAYLRSNNLKNKHAKSQYYPILWHNPEVLHIQWVKGVEQFLWVKKFSIKLVVSLRGSHIYLTPLVDEKTAESYQRSFPKIDGIHAVCQDLLDTTKEIGLPVRKSKVIYSGLNLADFAFVLPSKRNRQNKFKIVSVGRASWMKGFATALDAMSLIKKNKIDYSYTIVGAKGSEELSYQVQDLDLEKESFLLDWQPFDEVKRILINADVLLVSSVSEGIANVAIEAMSLGTIVISTDCGGMKELISNNETGYLIEMRSPQAIFNAIIASFEMSIEEKDMMAKNARKRVEELFDMNKNILKFDEFYKEIAAA